jgi:ribosome production factor 2
MDLTIRRTRFAAADLWKEATKVPPQLKPHKTKNVETTVLKDKLGQLHMQRQDLSTLSTRKFKGLRKRSAAEGGEGEQGERPTSRVRSADSSFTCHRFSYQEAKSRG